MCVDNWTHLNDVWPLLQSQKIDVQSKETEQCQAGFSRELFQS